jgi:hypothetical protein
MDAQGTPLHRANAKGVGFFQPGAISGDVPLSHITVEGRDVLVHESRIPLIHEPDLSVIVLLALDAPKTAKKLALGLLAVLTSALNLIAKNWPD